MGIGDLLGSISPAFGLFSGKGLGSYLKYLSPAYDIASLLGGHHNASPAPMADAVAQSPGNMPVNITGMAPQSAPGIQSADFSAMPQMSNPSTSPFSMIGNALMKSSSQGQTPPVQVPQAYAPQQSPPTSDLLQQLLASIGQGRY